VLEDGAGTGYNAALLAVLVGPAVRVVTVEISSGVCVQAENACPERAAATSRKSAGTGRRMACWAPYDGIIATADG
jgi:protein-L-isoaspartate(D-aspartate) O-methyltransferase